VTFVDAERKAEPVEMLWTAFCDKGIPDGQFQIYTLYYVAMREKFASEYLLCDTPAEAYEVFGQIVNRVGVGKFRDIIRQVAEALEAWAWEEWHNRQSEVMEAQLENELHARATVVAPIDKDEGVIEDDSPATPPIPADLYPPYHDTPAEAKVRHLDAQLAKLASINRRAEENYEVWEWDANTPPAWVNAVKITKDGKREDHFHRLSRDGQCDPSEDTSEPSGCRWKQYNPNIPCVHEMAFQKEMQRRLTEMIEGA